MIEEPEKPLTTAEQIGRTIIASLHEENKKLLSENHNLKELKGLVHEYFQYKRMIWHAKGDKKRDSCREIMEAIENKILLILKP